MNYYNFHIGDYISRTRHLSLLEDLAYRRMIDLYYMQEGPLPSSVEEVARLIAMREHTSEVEAVLREFFVLVEGAGWTHKRCEEELAHVRIKSEKSRKAAMASWKARNKASVEREQSEGNADAMRSHGGCNADAEQTQCELNADAMPPNTHYPTPNREVFNIVQNSIHHPERNIEKKHARTIRSGMALERPADVSEQVWHDFLNQRKHLRAPLTATALEGIKREAEKAGWALERALTECTLRGWRGFKADWVIGKPIERNGYTRLSEITDFGTIDDL